MLKLLVKRYVITLHKKGIRSKQRKRKRCYGSKFMEFDLEN